MARIDIRGDIVPTEFGRYYEFFKHEYTSPKTVRDSIALAQPDEPLDVHINSGGGFVVAAQEIYTTLLQHERRVRTHIESAAYSCAGWIAMIGESEISPVALLMVHNVMGGATGDYHAMEKEAEVLRQMNAALCEAFCRKTGKSLDEMLAIMDRETWLTANQCVEMGFVDRIMAPAKGRRRSNAAGDIWLTEERMQEADKAIAEAEKTAQTSKEKEEILKDLFLFGA